LTRYISIAHRLTGWNAVKNRAEQLDLALNDTQLRAITEHIKTLADQKPISLEDVDWLLRDWANGHGGEVVETKDRQLEER
jgi:homocitrate synthase